MFYLNLFNRFLLVLVSLSLFSSCAQSRRGLVEVASAETQSEVWAPQELCAYEEDRDNDGTLEAYHHKACFALTLNYSQNFIEFQVLDIGVHQLDAANFPYRVLARPRGSSMFYTLSKGDNIQLTVGGLFKVFPRQDEFPSSKESGHWIEDYEEFIVELESGVLDPESEDYVSVAPGLGERLVRKKIIFPELYAQNNNFVD